MIIISLLGGNCLMKKQFQLAPIFTDNMMFQANKPIRIFGSCKKGIELSVSFLGQEVKIKTKSTDFIFELKPISYQSKGFSFVIFTKKQKITDYNCLAGDLFLVAGGKNAYMPINESFYDVDIEDNAIRFLDVNQGLDENNEFNKNIKWSVCGRDDIDQFSAFSFLIARHIQKQVNKPLGIISCSNPETTIYSWLSDREINSHLEISNCIKENEVSENKKILNPSVFYDNMINKIIPFNIRAIVIYQGENDYLNTKSYSVSLSRLIQVSYNCSNSKDYNALLKHHPETYQNHIFVIYYN